MQQGGTALVLQGHALQPWTALSPVRTTPFLVLRLVATSEALDGEWGGCAKGAVAG
jgi:hypothetical protein